MAKYILDIHLHFPKVDAYISMHVFCNIPYRSINVTTPVVNHYLDITAYETKLIETL